MTTSRAKKAKKTKKDKEVNQNYSIPYPNSQSSPYTLPIIFLTLTSGKSEVYLSVSSSAPFVFMVKKQHGQYARLTETSVEQLEGEYSQITLRFHLSHLSLTLSLLTYLSISAFKPYCI